MNARDEIAKIIYAEYDETGYEWTEISESYKDRYYRSVADQILALKGIVTLDEQVMVKCTECYQSESATMIGYDECNRPIYKYEKGDSQRCTLKDDPSQIPQNDIRQTECPKVNYAPNQDDFEGCGYCECYKTCPTCHGKKEVGLWKRREEKQDCIQCDHYSYAECPSTQGTCLMAPYRYITEHLTYAMAIQLIIDVVTGKVNLLGGGLSKCIVVIPQELDNQEWEVVLK